jgi:hypothetical protein
MATNLQFIKSATGTSVSSLSVTDCFTDAYDVYYISITKADLSAANYQYARFIDSGGVDSTSNYDSAGLSTRSYDAFGEMRFTGQTNINNIAYQSANNSDGTGISFYVFNPYDSSSYTFALGQSSSFNSGSGLFGVKHISVHQVAEQITGINFFPASGTYDNIKINVYGVK